MCFNFKGGLGGRPGSAPPVLEENLLYDINILLYKGLISGVKTHQKVSKGQTYSKKKKIPLRRVYYTVPTKHHSYIKGKIFPAPALKISVSAAECNALIKLNLIIN